MAQQTFSDFAPKLTGIEAVTFAAGSALYATSPTTFAPFSTTSGGRALAGATGTANTLPYFTATDTVGSAPISALGRALIDDADAATMRTTLSLGNMSTQTSGAVAITGGTAFGLGGAQITGTTAPTTGSGLEIQGGASVALAAYNRTGAAYIALNVDASVLNVRPSGSLRMTVNAQGVQAVGSLKPSSYTVATVPSAVTHGAGALIYVSDESGGATPAYSDGAGWRRTADRALIT